MKLSPSRWLFIFAGLGTLTVAQIQTIMADDVNNYKVSLPTPPAVPSGSDVTVLTDDGMDIFLGPDLSSKVLDAFNSKCGDVMSDDCIDAMNTALGVGNDPGDGIQKRIAPLIAASSAITFLVSAAWARLLKSDTSVKTLSIHLPPAQTSSAQALDGADTFAWATKTGDPAHTFTMSAVPSPASDQTPSSETKDDGSGVIHLPGLEDALNDAKSGNKCKRDTDVACIVQFSESIVKAAQAGGGLSALAYMAWKFPQAKNTALVTTLQETDDFAKQVYIGPDTKARSQVVTAASWIAWANINENVALGTDMAFDASVTKTATEEDDECVDGPAEEDTPFCSNCGGAKDGKSEDLAGNAQGRCVGFAGDYFKGCPCYLDEPKDADDGVDVDAAWQSIRNFADLSDSDISGEPTLEFICFKGAQDVRSDPTKWKWTQRDWVAGKIEEFCGQSFPADEASTHYDSDNFDNNSDHDSVDLKVSYKGMDPPDRNTCIFNLRDQIIDSCDADARINQFNLKWGGRRTYSNGYIYEVQPSWQRVSTKSPNWTCDNYANRDDKGNKGKDGKDLPELIDDQMMKQMCVHQMFNMGWVTKSFDCGGSYNVIMTGSNGYRNSWDCWNYNYPCISDSIQNKNEVVMTGTHWPGSDGHTRNYAGVRCWIGFGYK